GGDELLDEIDAHAPGQEHVQRLGLRGADLRELGGVVELPERGVHLLDQLPFVVALEAGGRVVSADIVRREEQHALQPLRGDVLAGGLAVGLARPGRDEEERVALRPRVIAGPAFGATKKVLALRTSGAIATTMFENTAPVTKSTLSRRR